MTRRLLAPGLGLLLLGVAHPPSADAAPRRPPVVLVLVRDSDWSMMPPTLEPWATANLSLHSATIGEREMDAYLSIGKGGRTSGLGSAVGAGQVAFEGEGLRLLDWPAFEAHDHRLRYPGRIGALGQAVADAAIPAELVVGTDLQVAGVLADRRGVVARASVGGSLEVATALARGRRLVVAETDYTGVPSVIEAAGTSCIVVASSSTPEHSVHLGALAVAPTCGLGHGRLRSPTTRTTDFAVLADLAPTVLALSGAPIPAHLEGGALRAAPGHRSITSFVAEDHRARVTRRAERSFIGLLLLGALLGLGAAAVASDLARRRLAAGLLALPAATFLVDLAPWWRGGVVAGLGATVALAAAIAAVAWRVTGGRPRPLVAVLAATTALLLGLDAATGGRLQLDSALANNAIGAGRFTGMGNVPYGFFVAACLVLGALALDRWRRRGALAVAAIAAVAVVVDGAPTLGADVGGVLAAVPAFGLLLAAGRRSLPIRRLAPLLIGGVAVVALFAAFDLSRPVGAQTHLARALSGGAFLDTVVRREAGALHSVQTNPFLGVAVVAALGAWVERRRLPASRPLLVGLAALATVAVLGTALNDSGVAVGGAVAAVAWPAYLLLLAPTSTTDASPTTRSR